MKKAKWNLASPMVKVKAPKLETTKCPILLHPKLNWSTIRRNLTKVINARNSFSFNFSCHSHLHWFDGSWLSFSRSSAKRFLPVPIVQLVAVLFNYRPPAKRVITWLFRESDWETDENVGEVIVNANQTAAAVAYDQSNAAHSNRLATFHRRQPAHS